MAKKVIITDKHDNKRDNKGLKRGNKRSNNLDKIAGPNSKNESSSS